MNRKDIVCNIKKLSRAGFFSIIFSTVIAKIAGFCGGAILVRVLSKYDYGLYTNVNNTINMLMLLGDLGIGMAVMQYAQENYSNQGKFKAYCTFGWKMVAVFSAVVVIFILCSPIFYPYKMDTIKEMTLCLFAFPALYNLYNYSKVNLRTHMQNKKYSALNVLETFVTYVSLIAMSYYMGIWGAIMANYIYISASFLISLVFNRGQVYFREKETDILSRREKQQFFKLAISSQATAMIAQVMMLLDVFFIGLFFSNPEITASYKVATTIPAACTFVPQSVMLFAIPYFARNNTDTKWVANYTKKLVAATSIICSAVAVIGIATSGWLIPLIFGTQYEDAVLCYVILLIGFAVNGGVYIPLTNIIYTQKKVKVNLIINVICGSLNILFDIIAIQIWGSVGAALATAGVQCIGAIISACYCIVYMKKRKEN